MNKKILILLVINIYLILFIIICYFNKNSEFIIINNNNKDIDKNKIDNKVKFIIIYEGRTYKAEDIIIENGYYYFKGKDENTNKIDNYKIPIKDSELIE